MYKHTTYDQKVQKVNLLEMLKPFTFYDPAFVDNDLVKHAIHMYSGDIPLVTFLLNQPQTVYEPKKGVKLSEELKKLVKAKK